MNELFCDDVSVKAHCLCRFGLGLAFVQHRKDRALAQSHFSISLNAAKVSPFELFKVWVRFNDMYNLTKCVAMASATARRLLVVSRGGIS